MKTTSILSKNANFRDAINISEPLYKKTTDNSIINKDFKNFNLKGEKAIIINMFENKSTNQSLSEDFTYVIKQGDQGKLNENGTLMVYNLSEPVDIPIEKLLGKWNNTHIGVTLAFSDNKWSVKGGIENFVFKQEPFILSAFQRILKFVIA